MRDNLEPVSGRTSKGEKGYYKGLGCKYLHHASLENTNNYKVLGKNAVFYYGYDIQNENWIGKEGIFPERFQPYFSDWIGACGKKERNIFDASKFSRSAIVVDDCVDIDKEAEQMYFRLNYVSPRIPFLKLGNLKGLADLLKAMLTEGWNFPWDKAAIRDINSEGYVTDVADMFKSQEVTHQFGTIYSVLYSLFSLNTDYYIQLVKSLGMVYSGIGDIPFVCLRILNMHGVNIEGKEITKTKGDFYIHLIGNILLRGRNCASVEDINAGDAVMISYVENFKKGLPEDKRRIINIC